MKPRGNSRSDIEISNIMRKVVSKDTTPEIKLRKALWKRGLRYRRHYEDLPGKPDIVIPSKKLALFVDGDYWHGGQFARRNLSRLEDQFSNSGSKKREYWIKKIYGNMNRDLRNTSALLSSGWKVLRFWESELKRDIDACVEITVNVASSDWAVSKASARVCHRTVAEFFAGVGLARIGLERQGWRVNFANDIDRKKHEMYMGHFKDDPDLFSLEDVHQMDPAQAPEVSLATASFPCNDLSLAGSGKGLNAGQSSAFWGFMRVIKAMGQRKPPIILVENVPGFLTSKKGADFLAAMAALNDSGYYVDPFFLDAARFTPQSRPRLFVVARLYDVRDIPGYIELDSLVENELRPNRLVELIRNNPDINWRLRKLPTPGQDTRRLEDILEDPPHGSKQWWPDERAEYLLNQMSERHRKVADSMIKGAEWSYGAIFRRVRKGRSMAELRVDGKAGCLRTPRGGSGRQILFKAGKGQYRARLISPRECARLMGADDYNIDVPDNQALFGFGDGVCAKVMEWIAKYYLNPLACELIRGTPLHG